MIRSNVGDKFVLEEMIKHSYQFGGEQSGHIIFSKYGKTGDGILSALQTLALMLQSNKSSAQILNPFELYPQLQKNINIKHKKPLDLIQNKYLPIIPKNVRHIIRYSGTENKLRILLEGKDENQLESTMQQLIDCFEQEIN